MRVSQRAQDIIALMEEIKPILKRNHEEWLDSKPVLPDPATGRSSPKPHLPPALQAGSVLPLPGRLGLTVPAGFQLRRVGHICLSFSILLERRPNRRGIRLYHTFHHLHLIVRSLVYTSFNDLQSRKRMTGTRTRLLPCWRKTLLPGDRRVPRPGQILFDPLF